jgi:Family of unknown function (DUF5996)
MNATWPILSYKDAKETYETWHLWTQIIGKIKLAKLPWINHSWHVTFLVTPTGLTTLSLPDEQQPFQIDFNIIHHQLMISTQSGESRQFGLAGLSVADFYSQVLEALQELGIAATINPVPNELEVAIPFDQDTTHKTYIPEQAAAFHQALLLSQEVLTRFRARFVGKCSPVHFFWGGFDLAVSRFSGRKAPKHPGGVPHLPDWVAQEAYSHEVCSCGFWPGNELLPEAAFYTYIYPEPEGFKDARVEPAAAYYHEDLREFILPYEKVRQSPDPEKALMDFLQSTYEAAADLAHWDRENLETHIPAGDLKVLH